MRDAQYLAPDCATGNGIAIMSNRISYFFDIHGPSMTVDTGCSASLICIHQAVQSLLNGESSMVSLPSSSQSCPISEALTTTKAMAGGAGMILTPSTIMPMVSLGFLSKDGRCYTFDSRANGYGRGEGVGIVVLKRLSDAIRDNDTIRGVIRGTSTNQDGRTSGITMPSSEAQVANIKKCYASAGLDFEQTMFVECHGTGTQAGDPRELKAISDALCNQRPGYRPLLVGSIKTNIGHLEGSAGVAGVIKAVMTIEKGSIPRHINFQSWNPDIDCRGLKVDVPLRNTPWPRRGLRRISVNSFGFGGSNAHAIIDDAAHYLAQEMRIVAHHNTSIALDEEMDIGALAGVHTDKTPYLFVFSANDQGGVARIADAHLSYMAEDRPLRHPSMRDYAYTLFSRRSKLQYKSFVVARNREELLSALAGVRVSQPLRSQKSRDLNLAFVFAGQGAQWPRMGVDLCIFPPFKDSLEQSSALLNKIGQGFGILTALLQHGNKDSDPKINDPLYAQSATTAVQIALVDLLTACQVKPTAVVGHSSGEVAAAYAAGIISRETALTIAYFRGKLASSAILKGSMLAVGLSSSEVQRYIHTARHGSVCVACVNSPESVTLSGDTDSIMQIRDSLNRDGITNKVLAVKTAYHSPIMRSVSGNYQKALGLLIPKRPLAKPQGSPAMFSSVTGRQVSPAEIGPSYWANNMASPVEFEKAVLSTIKAEKAVRPDVFLELSPHGVLQKALSDIAGSAGGDDSKREIPHFPMMVRDKDGPSAALKAVGEIWARGLAVQLDWLLHQQRFQGKPKCLVDLPTYPWDHSKAYWHESHLSKAHRFRKFGSHDFLGAMTADSITPQEPRWRGFIDITENPWIEHHRIQKKTMYPASGMVVMAVEAAKQIVDGAVDSPSDILDFEISDFKIEEPMIIPPAETRLEYNFNTTRTEESTADRVSTWRYSFTIYSILDTKSAPPYQHTANARGFLVVRFRPRGLGEETDGAIGQSGLDEALKCCPRADSTPADFANGMNPREFYERLNIIGLNYGRLFRNITAMSPAQDVPRSRSAKYCWTKVQIPNTGAVMPEEYETASTIHPATLDAMFQSLFVLGDEPMVPYFIASIRISADIPQGAGTEFVGYSEAKRKSAREATSDIVMWHGHDRQRPFVSIRGLGVITMEAPGKAVPDFLPDHRNLCSQIVWKEDFHGDKGLDDEISDRPTFETMLELMGHRFPGLRVLQVGGESSIASLVLRVLGSETTPRLSSYLVLDEREDVFQSANEETPKDLRPLLSYQQLVDKSCLADNLKQQKFDIVLADSRTGIDRGVLVQILKPTGVLAFTHQDRATNSAASVRNGVLSGRFQRTASQSGWVPGSWYSLPQAYPAKMSTETVILLTAGDAVSSERGAPPIVAALASRLQSMGMGLAVMSMHLAEFRDVLESETGEGIDAFVVSLLELNSGEGVVYKVDDDHYGLIQKLFRKTNKGLLWLTTGAQMDTQLPTKSPFLGWARTVRSEEPDRPIVCLDLEVVNPHKRRRTDESMTTDAAIHNSVSAICGVFFRSFASTVPVAARDVEFAQRAGRLYIPRLEPLKEMNRLIYKALDREELVHGVHPDRNMSLTLVRGASADFEDVCFKEDMDTNGELQPYEVLIDVEECCIIPVGSDGTSDDDHRPGYSTDVWGTVAKVGTGVAHISPGQTAFTIGCGAVATHVIADQCMVWAGQLLPRGSFTHPPTCLIAASFCLGRLNKGARVLVHGAAGPHGQAAIQVASNCGAEVFGVVADEDQRNALAESGVLDDEHTLDGGEGLPERVAASGWMDLIYNPTADHRAADLRMVRPYGQVIYLTAPGATLAQDAPAAGCCFQPMMFDFGTLMERYPEHVAAHLNQVHELMAQPVLKKIYTFGHVRAAFRDLKGSPFFGVRVLRRIQKERLPLLGIPRDVYPAPHLSRSSTYVIAGGLGGLGLDVVKWLADHGARHVTILSRSSNHGQTAHDYLESVRQRGVQIAVMEVDICNWDSCVQAFASISSHHTTAGIVQAAAVIKVRLSALIPALYSY